LCRHYLLCTSSMLLFTSLQQIDKWQFLHTICELMLLYFVFVCNIQPGPKRGQTQIFPCIFQMLWLNLIIFSIHRRQVMINGAVQKLNNNIHYEGTTEMNSNNVLLHRTAHRLTLPVISYLQGKKSPLSSLHFTRKQARLQPGELCSVGSPAAASILW